MTPFFCNKGKALKGSLAANGHAFLLVLILVLFSIITVPNQVLAYDPVQITSEDRAINLTSAVEIFPQQGAAFQVSTAPGTDGIVRRIEVRATGEQHAGNWAVFVLANGTSEQIDRLIVAPHYRIVNAGIIWPDLGSKRINSITPSEGFALDREQSDDADIFRITLNPGTVVTFVVELTSDNLPQMYLWEPGAYKDTVNSFTLYKGILIGIAGLLAVFLTNLFIVRWTAMLPATAMLAWTVLTYISVDFGFLPELLSIGPEELQYWRAGAEVLLAGSLIIFLFTYLSLHNWHTNLSYLTLVWLLGLAGLFSIILIDAAVASGIARISLATTVVLGVFVIGFLAYHKYDRAVMLIPTWLLLLCWLLAAGMTITGQYDNDILQPALGGGMVLVVLLLSFTVMQHVFTSGIYQQGLFSDAERQSLALTGSGDIVWDWDVARDRLTTNPDISKPLGLAPNSLHGSLRNWLPLMHPNDRDSFSTTLDIMLEVKKGRIHQEFRIRASDNHYHWFSLKARPVIGANGEILRCVGTIQDITEQKIIEARLLKNAVTDSLTGLPNEELFLDRLQTHLVMGNRDSNLLPTVLIIDLDSFKQVNKAIGMAAGDTIMLALTRRIRRLLKEEDLMARMSGDQFGVILMSESDPKNIAELADAISQAVKAPIDFAKKAFSVTASIGMFTVVNTNASATEILADAELAMLHAKRFGGDRIEPFKPAYRSTGLSFLSLQENMKNAIARGEITVVYQPIVKLDSLEISGFEALLRWEDPKKGIIPPSEFIPLAEKNSYIFELGLLALKTAVEDMSSWHSILGDLPIFMSINLSAAQLMKTDLFDDIQAEISRSKCAASKFKFELTETVVMGNPDIAAATFEKIRQAGMGLSLDDFGTGYSSMSYLTQFPFDVLKIDRNIIVGKSEKHSKMRKSIVNLAKDLDLQIVAEGVETTSDVEELSALGCDYGQSYLLGKPGSSDETLKLLRERFSSNVKS
ncbi:EAL domain-containing protein [Lentilitoribacter sp. Alg239-R112]|uniref:EAL domain-containing protein n=1 Tax=Lentilitoribacter sp. Alg239-R112 TaxID=2305987 RepID=UPI0013A6B29B|nr:EAL domain-containing protein [Lentilitoribacter sp. Alg239-R112]